jgi:hypothetical protein
MPDLETLLRETKPEPDPAWTLQLDTRVADRFPTPPSRAKRVRMAMRNHLGATIAGVTVAGCAAVAVVVGVSSYTTTSGSTADLLMDSQTSEDAPQSAAATAVPEIQEQSAKTPARIESLSETRLGARAVRSSASLTLSTTPDRVQGLTNRTITIVDGLGGYVQSSQIDQPNSRRSIATLSLRIPSAKLDDGLGRISKLANVQSRTQQSEDLTDQREALQAAVRDARADREGLRNRLSKATTDKERSRLRALLDRATRRVTQRQREVNELGQEVSYATVDLEIRGIKRSSGAAAPAKDDRWTPADALGDSVRVLEVIAGVLLVAFAIALPIAAIGVLAWILARITTRRRRERALEGA